MKLNSPGAEDPTWTKQNKKSGELKPGVFEGLTGIAVDSAGNVYVADAGYHYVYVFDRNGMDQEKSLSVPTRDEEESSDPGKFNRPHGIAVGSDGKVYVVDMGNHRIQVFDKDGMFLSSLDAVDDNHDQLKQPRGVVVADNKVYVTDTENGRIVVFQEGSSCA